jgi:hypothetical protein
MNRVAILLLLTLLINGCGSGRPTAQSATGGLWQAQLSNGVGNSSGFSFNTQFTVGSNGDLSISNFEFLNDNPNSCFPINGGSISGNMALTQNMATNGVTGTMMFTVTSSSNQLTLTGNVTGTIVGTTLSGGAATGSWGLTGTGGCSNATGFYTMKQSS